MKGYYAEKEKLDERIVSAEERLKQFAQTYGVALPLKEETLNRILDDVNTHASQQERYEEVRAKWTKFQIEHPEFKNGLPKEQKEQEELPAVDALIEAEKWKGKIGEAGGKSSDSTGRTGKTPAGRRADS